MLSTLHLEVSLIGLEEILRHRRRGSDVSIMRYYNSIYLTGREILALSWGLNKINSHFRALFNHLIPFGP